ncbi:MAG: PD-(D/E)XK nuclease family protein [Bacteroidales bacterium]|nr:PD-(D/E)XK nuclease family protein [Bacteroidales bacterium]
MLPFLQQVARHYAVRADSTASVFVFPNRRSMLFFKRWFARETARAGVVRMLPRMVTMADFFTALSGTKACDRITQILQLYDDYRALNPKAESLDDFIYWGDVLLRDFDDIDKYLVDARGLFANIGDLRAIGSKVSDYADPRQMEAISRLLGHFSREVLASEGEKGREVKERFRTLWDMLYPLYCAFREHLDAEGLAYEGMIYRRVAEALSADGESAADITGRVYGQGSRFIFTGLNALNACERRVMLRLRDAGLGEFCWDWGHPMLTDEGNIASALMRENIADFPQAFTVEWPENRPQVNVCAVPSGVGQTRLIPEILRKCAYGGSEPDFALVLPDESLLGETLSAIPARIEAINVTMGAPLSSSEWNSLMHSLLELQLHLRYSGGQWHFYHKQVTDILSCAILRSVMEESDRKIAANLLGELRYYYPAGAFAASPLLGTLFRPVVERASDADPAQVQAIAAWQKACVEAIAPRLGEGSELQKEFAQQYYQCLNRLSSFNLGILPRTWARLLDRLTAVLTVPFEGEPLTGLQLMGPLETRALDFRDVVILSASEGSFPARGATPSFIPPELRLAFSLPTYRSKDAIWAYYFFRLIARAEQVWMVYDSRTEGLNTGEESRYIKQLRYAYDGKYIDLKEHAVRSDISASADTPDSIPKTAEDLEKIRSMTFSASSVQDYIACPARFYYKKIKDIKAPDSVGEGLDASQFGSVGHEVLKGIYPPGPVTAEYLKAVLAGEDQIREKVYARIRDILKTLEVEGSDLIEAEAIVAFICKVVERDLERISETGALTIESSEEAYTCQLCGHRFYGVIDRLDSPAANILRVVDYKTGKDHPEVLLLSDAAPVFHGSHCADHKAALQFYIYDRMVEPLRKGRRLLNAMYAKNSIFASPVLDYEADGDFMQGTEDELSRLFAEMEDPGTDFVRNTKNCTYCDFKRLCGIKEEH